MGAAFNYVRGDLANRFWAKVAVAEAGTCWNWLASVDSRGYGNFGVPRGDGTGRFIMQRAHRIAWGLMHGDGLSRYKYLCHTCDNRRCVNPAHLFVGDAKANALDRERKGRGHDRSGEKNPRAKLKRSDVLRIRNTDAGVVELQRLFNVSRSTIFAVKNRSTWRGL